MSIAILGAVAALLAPLSWWKIQESIPSAELLGQWRQISASSPWAGRDGAGLFSMGGNLHLVGGWNPSVFSPSTVSEHWISTDDGLTWTQLADAPWEARHSSGWLDHNGKFFVIGGDTQLGHYQRDVWAYDDVNGWVQKDLTTSQYQSEILIEFEIN
ncbi:MAG: hypothetical protein ACK8QZ_03380 [Anaerolineales bacterium]